MNEVARARNVVLLTIAIGLSAAAAPPGNSIQVVIVGGAHAGTYTAPPAEIVCMDMKEQFTASYRDFGAHDPQKMSEAGLNILNPADAGAKRGNVLVAFGDPGKKPVSQYAIAVPGDGIGALKLTRTGKTAELSFEGKAKDGATVTVTARCSDFEIP
ncbi:MAG TPA: hypothetical protein VF147_11045 [Vicinamibacterales bacterium]